MVVPETTGSGQEPNQPTVAGLPRLAAGGVDPAAHEGCGMLVRHDGARRALHERRTVNLDLINRRLNAHGVGFHEARGEPQHAGVFQFVGAGNAGDFSHHNPAENFAHLGAIVTGAIPQQLGGRLPAPGNPDENVDGVNGILEVQPGNQGVFH